MKQPSDDIFFLIKSLSKSERRYFRQFASRHTIGEQNNYVQLFDAIDALDKYDENVLKAALNGHSLLKYFAVAKQYLYQQILESLHHFYQNNSVEEKLKKDLHLCKILIQKKLLQQAAHLAEKLKKQIEEQALWEFYPEYEGIMRRLLRSRKMLVVDLVQKSFEEYEKKLELLAQNNRYWQQSNYILSMHLENVKANQPEKLQLLNDTAAMLLSMGAPTDNALKIEYFKALATYFFMNGNIAEAANYNRQSLELFDSLPHLIAAEREQYISVFNNYIIDNHLLGNYELLESGIAKLRKLPEQELFKTVPNLRIKIIELTYSLQLNARIAQKQFEAALELLPELKKEIEYNKKSIALNYLLTFYYLMAYLYFRNASYNDCLDCLEELKNPIYKGLMIELQLAADRLLLLCHFELGNYLLLDNLLLTIRRGHRLQKVKIALEDCLFRYLKKLSGAINVQKKQLLFLKMREELILIKAKEGRAWNYFDFDAWLETKIVL